MVLPLLIGVDADVDPCHSKQMTLVQVEAWYSLTWEDHSLEYGENGEGLVVSSAVVFYWLAPKELEPKVEACSVHWCPSYHSNSSTQR